MSILQYFCNCIYSCAGTLIMFSNYIIVISSVKEKVYFIFFLSKFSTENIIESTKNIFIEELLCEIVSSNKFLFLFFCPGINTKRNCLSLLQKIFPYSRKVIEQTFLIMSRKSLH